MSRYNYNLVGDLTDMRRQLNTELGARVNQLLTLLVGVLAILDRYDEDVVAAEQRAEFDGALAEHQIALSGQALARELRALLGSVSPDSRSVEPESRARADRGER